MAVAILDISSFDSSKLRHGGNRKDLVDSMTYTRLDSLPKVDKLHEYEVRWEN